MKRPNLILISNIKDKEMLDGINFITDESGNNKAIILDLIRFKKDGVKDKAVFEALDNLQQLIDNALSEKKQGNTWDQAKEKLKNFNP
jgi:hypothetical protein